MYIKISRIHEMTILRNKFNKQTEILMYCCHVFIKNLFKKN